MEAKRYPFDFEQLEKGQVIAADAIEPIVKCKRDDKEYALKVLALKEEVERAMRELGRPVTIAMRGADMHVLSDEDASQYNDRHFVRGLRQCGRSLRRMTEVDVGQLSAERRPEHLRRLEVNGKTYGAAVATRRKSWAITGHKRTTPGLPQSSDDSSAGKL